STIDALNCRPSTTVVQELFGALYVAVVSDGRRGGASRDRTDDLIVANDALSQLSYSPSLAGYTDFSSDDTDVASQFDASARPFSDLIESRNTGVRAIILL